jgi:hypothetical protein
VNEEGETYIRRPEQGSSTSSTRTNRVTTGSTYVNEEGETYVNHKEICTHPKIDSINQDTVVVIVNGKKYRIERPDINTYTHMNDVNYAEKTIERKKTKKIDCSALDKINENASLADLQSKREMEDLKYHCEMRNNYDNVNDDLTLIKGQEWTVPQQRTPMCYSQSCHVANQFDQTSLIGTLIDDVEKNKYIMPEFSYTENV